MTAFRVVGMSTEATAVAVRNAVLAQDPAAAITPFLARQLMTIESRLPPETIRDAIAQVGFIAVPQRRRGDRIERTDMLQVAESTVIRSVGALYGGIVLGAVFAVFRVGFTGGCGFGGNSCVTSLSMSAIGFALLLAAVAGGIALIGGSRRLYRRIEGERYLRLTRRGGDRPVEDGTIGDVWVGRRPA
jgi:hypothetical protein